MIQLAAPADGALWSSKWHKPAEPAVDVTTTTEASIETYTTPAREKQGAFVVAIDRHRDKIFNSPELGGAVERLSLHGEWPQPSSDQPCSFVQLIRD